MSTMMSLLLLNLATDCVERVHSADYLHIGVRDTMHTVILEELFPSVKYLALIPFDCGVEAASFFTDVKWSANC